MPPTVLAERPNCQMFKFTHHIERCAALSLSSPLRAMVGASALDPGLPKPQLQGQTQATAQPDGTISISELSLLANPDNTYNVTITLPDFPMVSILLIRRVVFLLCCCFVRSNWEDLYLSALVA